MNSMNRAGKGGFTIVEAVVAGALIGIFALGSFTLFSMYAGAQDETAARLRLQRQADGLIDEIGRRVRGAVFVLGGRESLSVLSDEPGPPYDGGDSVTAGRVDTIVIRDSADVLVSFRIGRGNDTVGVVQIREGAADSVWSDFMIAGSRIEVVPGPAGNADRASWFGLWHERKQVSINMVLRTATRDGKVFTVSIRRGTFRCRN